MKHSLASYPALLLGLGACVGPPHYEAAPPLDGTTGGSTVCDADGGGGGRLEANDGGARGVRGAGGAGGAAGTGGAGATGGTGGVGGAGGTGSASALCATTAQWGPGTILALAAGPGGAVRVAVTPDERTMAWVEPLATGGVVHHVDRADPSSPFSATQDLSEAGIDPTRGIALGPGGLSLVAVRADGSGFVEYSRPTRADAFSQPSSVAFDLVNALSALVDGLAFADPVLSADGGTFLYSQLGTGALPTILESARGDAEQWPVGVTVNGAMLGSVDGKYRRPTGISADLRTLFFYDEVAEHLEAAFRAAPLDPFTVGRTLMAGRSAQPGAACSRLYYTAQQSATLGVWVAGAEP